MMRARRSAVVVEAERRLQERRARIGADIKGMRTRRRLTQNELAVRAELGRQVVGRLELGQRPLDIETLERIAVALCVPLAVGFDRDLGEDVADAGHLAIQEVVLRLARSAGYSPEFELPPRPNEPWRSADVALGSEAQRRAIEAECWNTFGDVGAAVRSSRRKLVELEQLAVARWGADASAGLVWVVRDTARNRALLNRYPEVFASTFTGSSHAWVRALTTRSAPPDGPGLVWCEVASGRLHAWHRRGGEAARRRGEGD
jgi:transcriptional regulator with XRE-family HTH domain